MSSADELTLRAPDGVEVFHRRWSPAETRFVVVLAHGMAEHSGRYERVATALTSRGAAVYAPDHRGHGRTAEATGVGRLGSAGIDAIVDDLELLRRRAVDEHPDVPVVLVGHSMGALLSQAYAEAHGSVLAGLVLIGSPGWAEGIHDMLAMVRQAVDAGMANEPVAALEGFQTDAATARTPFDWLSRDEAEVDAYIADPYCGSAHPMTYGFLAEVMALGVRVMAPEAIASIPQQLPILLMTGEADAASDSGANVRALVGRMQDAGLSVSSIWYPGARHEILNEINRDEVEADLLAWLEKVVRPG